jgi:hypothetical protein
MVSFVDGAAAAHTTTSLRAACDLLSTSRGPVSAVSVSGLLPDTDDPNLSVIAVAQRLAAEHDLAVIVSVEGPRFAVEFKHREPARLRMGGAG